MNNQKITKIIKEWVKETKFPYGWVEGFLDACEGCEEHWENTEENKKPLIDNYLLWGQWEDWKNEK